MLLHDAKCTARFIQPGKPWQNGFIESFHSTLRRDHLDVEVFFNLLDAQLKTGIYRNYYNQVRPHSVNTGRKIPKTSVENSPVLQAILIMAALSSGVLRP